MCTTLTKRMKHTTTKSLLLEVPSWYREIVHHELKILLNTIIAGLRDKARSLVFSQRWREASTLPMKPGQSRRTLRPTSAANQSPDYQPGPKKHTNSAENYPDVSNTCKRPPRAQHELIRGNSKILFYMSVILFSDIGTKLVQSLMIVVRNWMNLVRHANPKWSNIDLYNVVHPGVTHPWDTSAASRRRGVSFLTQVIYVITSGWYFVSSSLNFVPQSSNFVPSTANLMTNKVPIIFHIKSWFGAIRNFNATKYIRGLPNQGGTNP